MNTNRLINMLFRLVLRKALGGGVRALMQARKAGKQAGPMSPAERQQARAARQQAKRARQAAKLMRRMK